MPHGAQRQTSGTLGAACLGAGGGRSRVGRAELSSPSPVLSHGHPLSGLFWGNAGEMLGDAGEMLGNVAGCRAAQPGCWHISAELGSLPGSGWVTSRGPGSAAPQRSFYSAQSSPESPEQRPEPDRPAAPPEGSLAACSPGIPVLGAALSPGTRFLRRVRRGPCLRCRHLSSCC